MLQQLDMCWGLNSHCLPRDGHQPYSRGLYTHIEGGMTIPNIRSGSTLAHMKEILGPKLLPKHVE